MEARTYKDVLDGLSHIRSIAADPQHGNEKLRDAYTGDMQMKVLLVTIMEAATACIKIIDHDVANSGRGTRVEARVALPWVKT